jgi:large subunit ribosomal protein L32
MRHTRAHTANRRSHHALKAANLSTCSNCGAQHRPHHMCLSCGFYNGRQVMDLGAQKAKRDARIKAKEDRIRTDLGVQEPVTEVHKEHKEAGEKDTHKEAREKNVQTKRPVRRRESKG